MPMAPVSNHSNTCDPGANTVARSSFQRGCRSEQLRPRYSSFSKNSVIDTGLRRKSISQSKVWMPLSESSLSSASDKYCSTRLFSCSVNASKVDRLVFSTSWIVVSSRRVCSSGLGLCRMTCAFSPCTPTIRLRLLTLSRSDIFDLGVDRRFDCLFCVCNLGHHSLNDIPHALAG